MKTSSIPFASAIVSAFGPLLIRDQQLWLPFPSCGQASSLLCVLLSASLCCIWSHWTVMLTYAFGTHGFTLGLSICTFPRRVSHTSVSPHLDSPLCIFCPSHILRWVLQAPYPSPSVWQGAWWQTRWGHKGPITSPGTGLCRSVPSNYPSSKPKVVV